MDDHGREKEVTRQEAVTGVYHDVPIMYPQSIQHLPRGVSTQYDLSPAIGCENGRKMSLAS